MTDSRVGSVTWEQKHTPQQKGYMSGGLQNDPTGSSQASEIRKRFERDVVRENMPPYYLIRELHEKENGVQYKDFRLPYNAGLCRVSWENDEWRFNYITWEQVI